MWHPNAYLEQMYDNIIPTHHFQATNLTEWSSWHDQLQRQFIADLGGFPQSPAALDVQVLEQKDCGDYIRERVEFTTFAALRMPAYVLVPVRSDTSRARLPAVIACHGHGYGSREIVGLTPEGEPMDNQSTYQKNFAIELVKRGFIVIAPEILGFGDRRLEAEYKDKKNNSCDSISTFLLQMGQTMSGHRIYDTMRAIDYLQTRVDVDANQIGCMGISGGGLVAAFTSALDERIKATVVSGYVNTFKSSILGMHHCVDNYVPGLNLHAEMPDLISLIAPRPLLVEAGTRDPIFPLHATLQSYEQIRKVYQLLGDEAKLDCDIFEGDHQISGAKAYDWLRNILTHS